MRCVPLHVATLCEMCPTSCGHTSMICEMCPTSCGHTSMRCEMCPTSCGHTSGRCEMCPTSRGHTSGRCIWPHNGNNMRGFFQALYSISPPPSLPPFQAQLTQNTPQAVHQQYEEMLRGVREKSTFASQQLLAASEMADKNIKYVRISISV